MDEAATATLEIMRYLLPGFIVAWVYFGLTAHYRPEKFERVIQALIFSIFVQALLSCISFVARLLGEWITLGYWTGDVALVWSVIIALALGASFSWCANNDSCHLLLRRLRLTKQTSHPSQWFGAFNDLQSYVVLHIKGGRRLAGWPQEWPNKPTEGHFLIVNGAWLLDDNNFIELLSNKVTLVPACEVEFVEFLEERSEGVKIVTREEPNPSPPSQNRDFVYDGVTGNPPPTQTRPPPPPPPPAKKIV